MQTENLQELIKTDATESMFSDVEDIPITWEEDKEDDFSPVPSGSRSPEPKSDRERVYSAPGQSVEPEMSPRESTTEDDLIAYTKFLHARMAISTAQCYWLWEIYPVLL